MFYTKEKYLLHRKFISTLQSKEGETKKCDIIENNSSKFNIHNMAFAHYIQMAIESLALYTLHVERVCVFVCVVYFTLYVHISYKIISFIGCSR